MGNPASRFDSEPSDNAPRLFKTFEDLEVYRLARIFRTRIYALARTLPPDEKFNLKPQMMDAARSLTNNIAEGHGRYQYQESMKFMRDARGSLQELIDDINICIDERYAARDQLDAVRRDGFHLLKVLNGYIAYLSREKASHA